MEIRTTKPKKGNKFYNTKSNGGLSICIKGYPTDKNADVLSNCVGYACGRFNEIIGKMKYPYFNCNAEDFIKRAKEFYPELIIETDINKPKVGAIVVHEGKGSKAGHVYIIERINEDGSIYTSESAYGGKAFFNATRKKSNNYGLGSNYPFLGYIYNPSVIEVEPTPSPEEYDTYKIKKGDNLNKIAKKYNTTVDYLMSINPSIEDKNLIYDGATMNVPKIKEESYKVGDKVNPIEYVNSKGLKLRNYDDFYYITQIDSNNETCVLSANRNGKMYTWARVYINNLEHVK